MSDLRTALTKLAEDWPGGFGEELRTLLAAHPAPEHVCTVHCDGGHYPAPEADEDCENCLGISVETCMTHPASVSDTRREDSDRLGPKYRVARTSDPTGKHVDCRYFVLDPLHDPHAVTAMRAYSAAARTENSALADDLDAWVLPAPPVVDEAEIAKVLRSHSPAPASNLEARIGLKNGCTCGESGTAVDHQAAAVAAHLRGATRG